MAGHPLSYGWFRLIAGILTATAIGGTAMLGVYSMGRTAEDLYLHPFQVSNAALDARYEITAMHRSMRELLLASTPDQRNAALADIDGRMERTRADLMVVQRLYLGNPAEVSEALAALDQWEQLRRNVAALAVAGRRDEARALMTGGAGTAFATIDARINGILTFARARAASYAAEAERHRMTMIPVIAVLSAGLGALLLLVFRSWLRLRHSEERTSRALAASEERFRTVQEMSLDGFAIFRPVRDKTGAVIDFAWEYANTAALRMCRTTAEVIRRCTLTEVLPQAKAPGGFFYRHCKVLETGVPDVYETYYDGGGVTGWFRNMAVRLGDGVAVSFADITDIKRAQLTKSHFLASVSHDLRQPLQALRLFVDVIDAQTVGPARKAVEGAGQALTAAEQLLTTLLDVSRLQAGLIDVYTQAVDLGALMRALAEEARPQAEKAGIAFHFQPCAVTVKSDAVQLGRILRNLLQNALRYTGQGRILFGARRVAGGVRIEVWDSGPGIPPDQMDAIFEDFYQLGNVARDRAQGLGLGLGIVRRIAQLLNHPLGLRSWPGRGSVFSVTVPLEANTAPSGQPVAAL